jgi:hypothetical protein
VYKDIQLPSWQVVFSDKLLQFRPPDLLRLSWFGLAGATAVLAQLQAINPTHHSLILLRFYCYGKLSASPFQPCLPAALFFAAAGVQGHSAAVLAGVFSDKLLQFQPLDLLRLNLFGFAGAGAVLAQLQAINPTHHSWILLRSYCYGKLRAPPLLRMSAWLQCAPLLQVYRDISLPCWQVVSDKLLQFRPPDLLRLEFFGLAGANAVLAQLQAIHPTHHYLILLRFYCYEKFSAPPF